MASAPPTKATLVMNLVDMTEVRVENHKMMLPAKLLGTEEDNERAITFYATAGKLAAATKEISAQGRITALANNVNQNHVGEINLRVLFQEYTKQLFTPSNWTVRAFQGKDGRRLNSSVTDADPQILMPAGDDQTNLGANARRENNIGFVHVSAKVDLSNITGRANSLYSFDTFIQLPTGNKTVKNSNGNDVVVRTFLGKADIRTYTAEEFQTEVLDLTRQCKPATLSVPSYGTSVATMDYNRKEERFREEIVEGEWTWLQNQLWRACCPGVAYRPSSALTQVKQISKDENGNETRLPMLLHKHYDCDELHGTGQL